MKLQPFLDDVIKEYGEKIAFFAKETLSNPKESENLHQFRVYTRRVRSILKEFETFFEPNSLEKALLRLKEYQKMSNHARDIDVFLKNLPLYINHLPTSMQEDFLVIESILKKMQSEAYEELLGKLKEVDVTFLKKLQFVVDEDAKKVIKKRLKKRFEGIVNSYKKEVDDASLHALRIKFKKLRYVFELLLRLEGDHKAQLKSLKKIQDLLGAVQDRRVQAVHLKDFAKNNSLSINTLLSLGKVIGDLEIEKEQYKLQFRSTFKQFQKKFKL